MTMVAVVLPLHAPLSTAQFANSSRHFRSCMAAVHFLLYLLYHSVIEQLENLFQHRQSSNRCHRKKSQNTFRGPNCQAAIFFTQCLCRGASSSSGSSNSRCIRGDLRAQLSIPLAAIRLWRFHVNKVAAVTIYTMTTKKVPASNIKNEKW